MKATSKLKTVLFCSAIGLSIALSACSDDEKDPTDGSTGGEGGEPTGAGGADATGGSTGATAGMGGGAGESNADESPTALILAERVFSDEGRHYYVSVLDEVPDGPIDRSNAREFPSADIELYEGAVFVRDRESNTMTRFEVDEDLALVERGKFSFANTGLASGRMRSAYLSPTKAYVMDPGEWRLLEWNPSDMKLAGNEISLEFAAIDGLDGSIGTPARAGDKIIAPIYWANWDTLESYAKGAALVIDPDGKEKPTLIEDARISSTYVAYAGDDDAAYLAGVPAELPLLGSPVGGKSFGSAGLLRVEAGADEFDANFVVDVGEITGSPLVWSVYWRGGDQKVLAQVWDPETPLENPKTSDEIYVDEYIYVLVDPAKKTWERVKSLPKSGVGNAGNHVIDGTLYINVSDDTGSTVYPVTDEGVGDAAFRVPGGDIWHFERLQ